VKQPIETPALEVTDREIAKELEKAGIAEPLPYTEDAVFKAATCNWIRIHQQDHPEQLRRWTGRVIIGGTEGTLRSILANYRLDWLLGPTQPGKKHPREVIREKLEAKLQKSFSVGNSVGAKILKVELGEIQVRDFKGIEAPEDVYDQWVDAWQADWERRAIEDQVRSEAELARSQAAQIQARAEMGLILTEAIRPLIDDGEGFFSYLLAAKLVEALRWLGYDPLKRAFDPSEVMQVLDELENAKSKKSE
jgi:regulator of protease activity HflC (stomatin/prohibitin superfamily)